MKSRSMAPLALLLNSANPIMAQGAAFAGLTFMDRFERDITHYLKSGDWITVEPELGRVTADR